MKQKIIHKCSAQHFQLAHIYTNCNCCKKKKEKKKSSTGSHIPAHCNKKVSPVTNYDANSLWERIKTWPLLLPKLQSGCKWGRKKGLNLRVKRLFRREFQHLHCESSPLHSAETEPQIMHLKNMHVFFLNSTSVKFCHHVWLNIIISVCFYCQQSASSHSIKAGKIKWRL